MVRLGMKRSDAPTRCSCWMQQWAATHGSGEDHSATEANASVWPRRSERPPRTRASRFEQQSQPPFRNLTSRCSPPYLIGG